MEAAHTQSPLLDLFQTRYMRAWRSLEPCTNRTAHIAWSPVRTEETGRQAPVGYPGDRRRGARPGGWVGGSRGGVGGMLRTTGAVSVTSIASP